MLWPKNNSYKEFANEKKFLRLENSPPPHNFSNGPSLRNLFITVPNIANDLLKTLLDCLLTACIEI